MNHLEHCLVQPHSLIRVIITASTTLTNTTKLLLTKSIWMDVGGKTWDKVLGNYLSPQGSNSAP